MSSSDQNPERQVVTLSRAASFPGSWVMLSLAGKPSSEALSVPFQRKKEEQMALGLDD